MKIITSLRGAPFPATLFLVALFTCFNTSAQTVTLDRVVAVVDDGVVLWSELQEQTDMILARLEGQQDGQLPPREVLREQVLDHLIVQQLQLQMAERAGVTIEDEEINQAIDEMQRGNGLNREQFLQQLAREGLTVEKLRDNVRKEIMVNRVQRGVVGRRIDVTEHDVESFLNSKEGQFWTSPEYHLGHIFIPVSSSAPQSEVTAAYEKARDLAQQARDGAEFSQLAIRYSAGQNALNGGDMGWRKAEQLPELFAENLGNVGVGEITEPLRSGAGFHLLKIQDQRGGGERLIEQSKVRHILLTPSEILTEEEAQQKLLGFREKILNGEATFAELAKENTEDIGSKQSGGDVGWSMPGQFVPAFEATIAATEIGEISMPFRSQFGWHILTIEDRRKQDMSETMIRNQAMNLLYSRRFEEELPIWLQEIRDEAFVDVKLTTPVDDGADTDSASVDPQ